MRKHMKKNIKKVLTVSLLTLCLCSSAMAKDKTMEDIFRQGYTQGAKEQAKVMLPIWEKATKCTPAKSNDGSLEIYGKENGQCHIRYSHNDCYLPDKVLKKYTKAAIKHINNTLAGNCDPFSAETRYMQSVQNNEQYCKIKY